MGTGGLEPPQPHGLRIVGILFNIWLTDGWPNDDNLLGTDVLCELRSLLSG